MACRLLSAKPLSEPVLAYVYAVKFESIYDNFYWRQLNLKSHVQTGDNFVSASMS